MGWEAIIALGALVLALLAALKTYFVHDYRLEAVEQKLKKIERRHNIVIGHLLRQKWVTPEVLAEMECKDS